MTSNEKVERLWRVRIGEENNEHELYVVSENEPVLVEETVKRKLRRLVGFTFATDYLPSNPIFSIPLGQGGSVEEAKNVYGFPLKQLTDEWIVLAADNPENKTLYEVALFAKHLLTSFRKMYVLAHSKRKAQDMLAEWKKEYKMNVQPAKKMNCYRIIRVTEAEIVLDRSITKKLDRWQKMALLSSTPQH